MILSAQVGLVEVCRATATPMWSHPPPPPPAASCSGRMPGLHEQFTCWDGASRDPARPMLLCMLGEGILVQAFAIQ